MSANNKVCGVGLVRRASQFRITNDNCARPYFAATPQVLILGANGRVGLAVAQAFAASGWHVLAQVRRDAAAGMPSSATLVREPLTATATLATAAQGARVVVYAVNPAYTAWAREALPGLRQGLARKRDSARDSDSDSESEVTTASGIRSQLRVGLPLAVHFMLNLSP